MDKDSGKQGGDLESMTDNGSGSQGPGSSTPASAAPTADPTMDYQEEPSLEDQANQTADYTGRAESFKGKVLSFLKDAAKSKGTRVDKSYTPEETRQIMDQKDQEIAEIGLDDRIRNLPSYIRGPVMKIYSKFADFGDGKIAMTEENFIAVRDAAEGVLEEISQKLSDDTVGQDSLPRGLYLLQCEYEARMIDAAKSGVEAEELSKEAYAEKQKLRGELVQTPIQEHAKKKELYGLIKEYQTNLHKLRMQAMKDKGEFVSYDALQTRTQSEIEIMEGLYELLSNKTMAANMTFYSQCPVGADAIAGDVTTVGKVMSEMFGKLQEFIEFSSQKTQKTEEKIQQLRQMKMDYETPVTTPDTTAQHALADAIKDQEPFADSITERMRTVANYEGVGPTE